MNDNNELITKGFLRDTLRVALSEFGDSLAVLINKSFQEMESWVAKQEDLLALTDRVSKMEKRFEKHSVDSDREFKAIHKNFDIVFSELKDIRKQLNRVDTRADVLDLQIRVGKLERKAEM